MLAIGFCKDRSIPAQGPAGTFSLRETKVFPISRPTWPAILEKIQRICNKFMIREESGLGVLEQRGQASSVF